MDKTIVVRIDVVQKHERYGKVVRRSTKLHAHDEHNTAGVGDLVRARRDAAAERHQALAAARRRREGQVSADNAGGDST